MAECTEKFNKAENTLDDDEEVAKDFLVMNAITGMFTFVRG